MISRKILIIHDSRVIRSLIKGYILSELDDVLPLEASSGNDAIKVMEKEKVETILCSDILKDCEGYELLSRIRALDQGSDIPFIIFTSTTTKDYLNELQEKGVKHYLASPFTAQELRSKINEVFDPRTMRQQQRYNVPGTQAIVHLENQNIAADVINLSLGSAYCEFTLPPGAAELLNSIYISIRFPVEFEEILIANIYCKLLSIKTVNWLPNDAPGKVRAVWLFKNLSDRNRELFVNLLNSVEEKNRKLANI